MTALILCIVAGLDAVFGEPKTVWSRVPHPVVLMGRCVTFVDTRLNTGPKKRLKGTIATVILGAGFAVLGAALTLVPYAVVDVIVVATLLAQKSLVEHVHAVALALGVSTQSARESVAMIVGRDTADMDENEIARAAIESGAENFSDGVIAPAFWFLLAGLPGLLVYKITNTADSMIGYKTEKYRDFGWAAARFDDVLNWIPARITALLIVASARRKISFTAMRKDAQLHRSPNAGWPEAAMARAINVALSGPRSYDGTRQEFPFVNADEARTIGATHINDAIAVLWKSWAIGLGLAMICGFIL